MPASFLHLVQWRPAIAGLPPLRERDAMPTGDSGILALQELRAATAGATHHALLVGTPGDQQALTRAGISPVARVAPPLLRASWAASRVRAIAKAHAYSAVIAWGAGLEPLARAAHAVPRRWMVDVRAGQVHELHAPLAESAVRSLPTDWSLHAGTPMAAPAADARVALDRALPSACQRNLRVLVLADVNVPADAVQAGFAGGGATIAGGAGVLVFPTRGLFQPDDASRARAAHYVPEVIETDLPIEPLCAACALGILLPMHAQRASPVACRLLALACVRQGTPVVLPAPLARRCGLDPGAFSPHSQRENHVDVAAAIHELARGSGIGGAGEFAHALLAHQRASLAGTRATLGEVLTDAMGIADTSPSPARAVVARS